MQNCFEFIQNACYSVFLVPSVFSKQESLVNDMF